MKLFNILFLAIKESEFDFLKYRHSIDSEIYTHTRFEVTHLKLAERGFTVPNHEANEVFFPGKNRFFYIPLKLIQYVRKQKHDLIMVHGFTFPFQTFMLRAFIPKSTKLIIQHHAEKPFKHPIKRWFQKMAYSRADAYLFASKELALPYFANHIIKDQKKVYEVMEGSTLFRPQNKAEAKKRLGIKEDTLFLWVGRLDQNKDPLTVLKGFHKFKEAGNTFQLVMIYGSRELEAEIKKYIHENQLQHEVTLLGIIPHAELENWYNAADYFVAASHYEGSGIALCEAMSCGCIPIVTGISSFVKMTNNGMFSFLFEPGKPDQLFEKLVLATQIDKAEMHEKIIEHFNKELSLSAIGRKIEAIAESLLQQ